MIQFRISPEAEKDIESILVWTHQQFGERIRLHYEELLVQAILDVAADPHRAGTVNRAELAKSAFTYHLWYSRARVNRSKVHIHKPRHLLLFRVADDGCLEISRVLHDSMDISRHLPPDYQSDDSEPTR